MHPDLVVGNADFRDLRGDAAEALGQRDAAGAALGWRRAPTRPLAASRSTAAWRGASASSARRKASGSAPAASASSSTNASTAKMLCEWPTERHQNTGTRTAVEVRPSLRLGMA